MLATSFEGVNLAYAVQAGREVRVIVNAESVDDRLSAKMAHDIAKRIEDEMRDRFGRPDEPVRNLLDSSYIRHYAAGLHISEMTVDNSKVTLFVPPGIEVTRDSVEDMVKKSSVKLQFSFDSKGMAVSFIAPDESEGTLSAIKKVLQAISK